MTITLQYIERRGAKYRVRFPASILTKRWLGTYDTEQLAVLARDSFLRKDSLVNESSTPTLDAPAKAWNAVPLQLPLDDVWLYCADFHAGSWSPLMVSRLVAVARHYRVKRLVIGGDLMDWPSISAYPNVTPQHTIEYTQEATGMLMSYLGDVFEEIDVFSGNHDQRIAKKIGGHITLESLIYSCIKGRRFGAKLVASDFTFAYFGDEGDGGPDTGIVAGHPTFYSSIPAKGIAEVAMIQHRNALGSHSHLQGMIWSRCGRYWAIDPGCMADEKNTPYHQIGAGISKFSVWKQGFVLLHKNIPTIMADGLVNWKLHGANE